MKLETLTKALQRYLTDCDPSETISVCEALLECAQTAERYNDRELWKDAVCVVPLSTIIDAINLIAYDDFGKLAKPRGGQVPYDVFSAAARKYSAIEQLTHDQLLHGYEFLSDLWLDNEAYGEHNPDGTFKRADQKPETVIPNATAMDFIQKSRACLIRALPIVQAYQLTNEDVLEPDENDNLKKFIEDIQHLVG